MSRQAQTKGQCGYCERDFAKGGMIRHLTSCPRRREVTAASGKRSAKSEKLFHLRIQDAWRVDYWLDVEMSESATLQQLDLYLRAIWLECCGHMSRFSIGGWEGAEIPVNRRVDRVLEPGVELTHIYDFGESSETLVKVAAVREGRPTTRHPIALMARNIPPEFQCIECERPASRLCVECSIEEEVWGTLCGRHIETHPHDSYGEPIPLVNSPRLGMCGYEGPAEPPY